LRHCSSISLEGLWKYGNIFQATLILGRDLQSVSCDYETGVIRNAQRRPVTTICTWNVQYPVSTSYPSEVGGTEKKKKNPACRER
jgi:hypothetical protein